MNTRPLFQTGWLLFVLNPCLGFAQIVAPEAPVREHALVRLSIEAPHGAAWAVLPAKAVDLVEIDDGRQLVFAAPPGTYTVLAATISEGRPRIYQTSVTIASASDAPKPIPNPSPASDPIPGPPSGSSKLEDAARAYADSVPFGLREAARRIRGGEISNVNEAVELVGRQREAARVAYGRALDELTKGAFDASGRIIDSARYAQALDEAARAMGGDR